MGLGIGHKFTWGASSVVVDRGSEVNDTNVYKFNNIHLVISSLVFDKYLNAKSLI